MINNRVVHYKDVGDGCFTFRCDMQSIKFTLSNCNGYIYHTNGKDAYICGRPSYYASPKMRIASSTRFNRIHANSGKKLFVSPDSKISRDLLRNSGYKIVRDKACADFVIVPDPKNRIISDGLYNFGFKTTDGRLRLLSISRTDGAEKFTPEEINIIIDTINSTVESVDKEIEEYYYNDGLTSFSVYFTPKCEEYAEIWEGRAGQNYVLDSDVELIGSNTISVETLDVWRRLSDNALIEKTILNSDWQKYPCTVAVFLNVELPNYCAYPSGQWKWLLDQIDYGIYQNNGTFGERVVTPEDWNMLQLWALHRLGLDEKGGYATKEISDRTPSQYKNFLRTRQCFMPMMIENGNTSKNLISQVKNA